ncbi:hypothetical protein GCM10025868_35750 [Angustibacter aerolatus]|uniref:Dyp-type peroxidase N-terminal domain-containing protein n=1 Tax=Angustibacter aerolatus TaxID=1162965 RepID=A0ABQ6JM56_9ACTN|nr:Dyp-type peroxidase domain-containing protein [Angustibacter aerolatus]GMA88325.1 hypothetical protein GCM10025868_35750 [Angustibacter aerolatus]
MLTEWSQAAVAMTRGVRVPGDSVTPALPPADTGEAVGLPASALTVTVGFGPDLFDHRFGLAAKRPSRLAPLPALPGDEPAAAAHRRRPGDPGLLARPAGRLPRHPQPGPHRQRRGGPALDAWASVARRRPPARRPPRATSWGSRTAPATSRPRTPT